MLKWLTLVFALIATGSLALTDDTAEGSTLGLAMFMMMLTLAGLMAFDSAIDRRQNPQDRNRGSSGGSSAIIALLFALTGTTLLGCWEETPYFPDPERRLVILAKLPEALDQREKLIADLAQLIEATTVNDPFTDPPHQPPMFRLVRVKWVNTNGDFEFATVKIVHPSDRSRVIQRLAAFRDETLKHELFAPETVNDFESLVTFTYFDAPPSDILYVNYQNPSPAIPNEVTPTITEHPGCFKDVHFTFAPSMHHGMKAVIEQLGGKVEWLESVDWYRDTLASVSAPDSTN